MPTFFAAVITVIIWLATAITVIYEAAVDEIDDVHFYLTYTLPSDFHDTFGDLIGDLSLEERGYAILICIGLALLLAYQPWHDTSDASLPSSPTKVVEESKVEVAPEPSPKTSPLPVPTKPREWKHFGTKDYFPKQGVYYPPQYCVPVTRLSFPKAAPVITMKQPEDVHYTAMPAKEPQTSSEASKPLHEVSDVTAAPAEHLPAALPDHWAAVAPPVYQAPVAPLPVDPLELVFQELATRRGDLRSTLDAFCSKVKGVQNVSAEMLALKNLLEIAHTELKKYRDQLTSEEADKFRWAEDVHIFWIAVQPYGYVLSNLYGGDMMAFLFGVAIFGHYLNLQLNDLDMTPPPPPPPPPYVAQPPLAVTVSVPQVLAPTRTNSGSQARSNAPASRTSNSVRRPSAASTTTEATQAASRPSQDAPKTRLNISANIHTKTTTADLKGCRFEDDAFWAGQPHNVLGGFNRQTFNWSYDDEMNQKIWTFSAEQELKLSGTAINWQDKSFVKVQLRSKASAFKRATFVLRMQALAGAHNKDTTTPSLLGDLMAFLQDAGSMTDACLGTNDDTWGGDWCNAGGFFNNDVAAEGPVLKGLYKVYGKDETKRLEELWNHCEIKWLKWA